MVVVTPYSLSVPLVPELLFWISYVDPLETASVGRKEIAPTVSDVPLPTEVAV